MKHHLRILLTALLALMLVSCSKETTAPEEVEAPSIPSITFKGPQTNSTNTEAQFTKAFAEAMNSYSAYFGIFAGVPTTKSGSVYTWNYQQGGFSIRMTATLGSDGGYTWKIVVNGVDPSDQTLYNNWTMLEGSTSADGKNGTWVLYEDNSTIKATEFIWSTNASNVLTGTVKVYDFQQISSQITVTNNPDNTGELKMYEGTVLYYRSVWQANGSGQWWYYNTTTGQITSTGNWS